MTGIVLEMNGDARATVRLQSWSMYMKALKKSIRHELKEVVKAGTKKDLKGIDKY